MVYMFCNYVIYYSSVVFKIICYLKVIYMILFKVGPLYFLPPRSSLPVSLEIRRAQILFKNAGRNPAPAFNLHT